MEVMAFVIAILLGALIGLQREYHQQHTKRQHFAGLRTFILICLFGAMCGYVSNEIVNSFSIIIVGFIAVILLAVVSYIVSYLKYKDTTATTEVAAIIAFIIGVLCSFGLLLMATVLGIVIAAFLTFKERLHLFAKKIAQKELYAIVTFALISLVILPFLPNRNYSPMDVPVLRDILSAIFNQNILSQLDVFNFYYIWLMVILVAGISFLGYILVKTLGAKKGYGLTGFVGGLVSSTAVTLSVSRESKSHKKIVFPFVLAVVIASSMTFIRMIIEVIVVNNALLKTIFIPLGVMAVVGYVSALFLWMRKTKTKKIKEIEFKQPFALAPAIKFGLFFALIILIARVAQLVAGSVGLYFTSVLSGLADVDAITLTMSSLSATGKISSNVAATCIILAAASNTLVKAGIAWFLGEKKFAKYIAIIFALILVFGLGSLLLIR